ADFAELHAAHGNRAPERRLERAAHQRDVETPIEGACERAQQLADRLATIPLAWDVSRHARGGTKRDAIALRRLASGNVPIFDDFVRHLKPPAGYFVPRVPRRTTADGDRMRSRRGNTPRSRAPGRPRIARPGRGRWRAPFRFRPAVRQPFRATGGGSFR